MKFIHFAAAALVGVFLAACGDDGTGSTPVASVAIVAEDTRLAIGETLQLTAVAFDDDGDEITGRAVEWSVSHNAVASITGDGLLTALTLGTFKVTAEIGGRIGNQEFTVAEPFGNCPIVSHTLGSTVAGILSSPDCRNAHNIYLDTYRFTVATRRQVTITMRSGHVNSHLFLANAAGDRDLASDNDGAGGNDARIVTTLDPGTYLIVATAYSPGNGPYTLTTQ